MIQLPNTNGMDILSAALVYAEAGIPIAPFDPTKDKGKSCGNLLGRKDVQEALGLMHGSKWYEHATCNVKTLRRWNNTLGGFQAIATSPGRFGAVIADIDKPELFPAEYRKQACSTAHIKTSGVKRRGHYWFIHHLPVANASYPWGELRSHGGGIVLPPYPLDNRHVVKPGRLLALPTDLVAAAWCVQPIDLDTWCAKYKAAKYPHKLDALVKLHEYHLRTCSPHLAMQKALRTGLGEAVIGFVSAQAVLSTLMRHWPKNRPMREFHSLAVWAAGVAEQADHDLIEAMSRRGKGDDSRRIRVKRQ